MARTRFERLQVSRRVALGALALAIGVLQVACGGAGGSAGAGGAQQTQLSLPTMTATPAHQPTRSPIPPVIRPTSTATTSAGSGPGASGPMVILTPSSAGGATAVTVGQVVQAQLPNNRNWTYVGQTGALLTPIAPTGERASNGLYLWTFRAQASGTGSLHFSGKVVCPANVACTPLVFVLNFSLRVSA
ncbi:MAG TPA: hypothetical protein VIG77_13330 [Ktedonobacterales bacterium]